MLFTEERALGLEGIQSRKWLLQGRAGGGAGGQTDRRCPVAPAASTRPLQSPESPVPGFVSSLFIRCQVRVVSSPWVEGVGGSGLNLRQAEMEADTRQLIQDRSRYKAP